MSLPGYENIPDLRLSTYAKRSEFVFLLKKEASVYHPMKAARIGDKLHLCNAQIAALRRALWKDGVPIGSGANGYWYAWKAEELDSTLAHIEARQRACNDNIRLVRNLMNSLRGYDKNQMSISL